MYTLEVLNRLISKEGIKKIFPYLLSDSFPEPLKKQLEQECGNLPEYLQGQCKKYGVSYKGTLCVD